MLQSTQNEYLTKIGNWIAPRIDRYETILAIIFLILLFLRIYTDLPVGVLITLTLITLSVMYFYGAFADLDDPEVGGIEKFINKLASMGLSTCLVGILFRLSRWPGSEPIVILGSVALVIALLAILTIQLRKPELKFFTSRLKLRILLVAALAISLYLTPGDELIKIGILETYEVEVTE